MPLAFDVTKPLHAIPAEAFNSDGIATIVAHGSRYGGAWVVAALLGENAIGEIETTVDDRPDMAVDTSYVWLNDELIRAGLKIVHFVNCNDRFPPDQAPFFALAQFLVVDKDWK